MLARTVVAVTLAALSAVTLRSSSKPLTPDDAAVIDIALSAASLPRLAEFSKGAPIPPLLLRSRTAAVCQAERTQKTTFCVDGHAKTLRAQLGRRPNVWPAAFYDAVIEQNQTPRDLSGMSFASATLTSPDTVSAYKAGKALAQVSQPTYLGNRAIVFVLTSYAWMTSHAVLVEKRAGKWELVEVEGLGRS